TIGGFLAHRGTGVLSTKYGKIEDMVMSLEVVTPTGEIIHTLPVPRHASGPDLTMLFLGSEGTLGVITEVTLKVHPQPEARQFRAYIFPDFHTAMQAGASLMRSRLGPCAMRLYDETETKTHVSKVFGIDLDKGAYLVFGFDGRKDVVNLQMKHAREIMEGQFHGKDLGAKGGEWWWENKYKFFYPGYMFHVPQAFGTLDTVADFAHIEKVYHAMKNVVNKEFPDARFIGHFSHWYEWGCMLYARFIFPGDKVPPDPRDAAALYNAVWDKAIRAAIANGGVINEHHGVGLKLGRYVKDLYGTAMPVLQGIKKQLDPNGIMNPGKMGL
ncbi:MAG: FAD-binding oxidoreductase, partial [Kiritimatiellae bacterium]|nr:FAD-binding oxidoreductase [Kiritimatiellia bacterium]